ncbi:MAG: hypothetical protein JWM78_1675 [Verrucomicrobiaceae bacterium]|nr:hypothetical protein [Verrucomicrobiaceae bacterium]
MEYTLYSLATGEIRQLITAPQSMLAAQVEDGFSIIVDHCPGDIYRVDLATHTAVLKTTIPYSIEDISEFKKLISILPADVIAVFDGEIIALPDGKIEFGVDLIGEYKIILRHPLYLETTIEISIT